MDGSYNIYIPEIAWEDFVLYPRLHSDSVPCSFVSAINFRVVHADRNRCQELSGTRPSRFIRLGTTFPSTVGRKVSSEIEIGSRFKLKAKAYMRNMNGHPGQRVVVMSAHFMGIVNDVNWCPVQNWQDYLDAFCRLESGSTGKEFNAADQSYMSRFVCNGGTEALRKQMKHIVFF